MSSNTITLCKTYLHLALFHLAYYAFLLLTARDKLAITSFLGATAILAIVWRLAHSRLWIELDVGFSSSGGNSLLINVKLVWSLSDALTTCVQDLLLRLRIVIETCSPIPKIASVHLGCNLIRTLHIPWIQEKCCSRRTRTHLPSVIWRTPKSAPQVLNVSSGAL